MQGAGQTAPPAKIPNPWKAQWNTRGSTDFSCCESYDKTSWVRETPDFDVDYIAMGWYKVQIWDLDEVGATREIPNASQYRNWRNVGIDVIQADRRMILAMKSENSSGGALVSYNIDSGEATEIYKDDTVTHFYTLACNRGGTTQTAFVSDRWQILLFDVNSGRPGGSFKPPDQVFRICWDWRDPNLFYTSGDRSAVRAWDKRTKTNVRSFVGLRDDVTDTNVPSNPGNVIIATDRSTVKIWDLGTGKAIHTFQNLSSADKCDCYSNVVAIAEGLNKLKIYDLDDDQGGTTQAVKELEIVNQSPREVRVLWNRIVIRDGARVWATNRIE